MKPRFEEPIIYLITAGEAVDSSFASSREDILAIIRLAIEERVSLIQIREKRLSARSLFHLAAAAAELTSKSGTRLLINDRADIALAAGADGVHLTANSIPPSVIRQNFPPDFIVGISTHSLAAASDAKKNGADFAVFGPVFDTPGKGRPCGLEELKDVCDTLRPFPIIGLGGIDALNYHSVLQAGAQGIAAIRALNDPNSLRAIARFSTVASDKCQVDSHG